LDIVRQKAELKDWIDSITDENIIEEILAIKSQRQFDFGKEWAMSISGDGLRKRIKTYTNSLHCHKKWFSIYQKSSCFSIT